MKSYQIQTDFPGYRAKEEATKLHPGTMVYPSKNVVTNTAGRVQIVKGYSLDGDSSTTPDNGIQGWFDFDRKDASRRVLRSGFLTSALNDGKVQFRYKNNAVFPATISYKTILSGLSNTKFSFTNYWDTTDLVDLCLFVNGDGNVYEWNGAVATILSSTVNSITIAGTLDCNQVGFYNSRNKVITINGTDYTYTGITGTTLTGITVDPTGEAIGSVFWQKVVTTAVSTMAPATFQTLKPDLIQKGVRNVIYYGQSNVLGGSNNVFVSKVDNFKDCTFTSPVRIVAEGMLYVLDAPPVAFIPQETGALESSYMIISAGKSNLYREIRTLSSDLTKETLEIAPLRTSRLQAILNHNSVSRAKNGIMFLGNDKVVNLLGQISNQYVPELTDLSLSIIDDMTGYDFGDCATFYHKNYLYQSVPKSGIIRIFNMTDPNRQYWEPPVFYPIAGFFVTEDGELGGHAYGSSESYLLFTGHRFRANPDDEGFPIDAGAYFAPYAHVTHVPGMRTYFPNRVGTKVSEEIWVDGYISENTDLNVGLNFDLDGCQVAKTKVISGRDVNTVCSVSEDGSFGSAPLGTKILGDGLVVPVRPPYFNAIKTFNPYSYRFEQVFFTSYGIDLDWQIISFGTDSMPTNEQNNEIRA